jgi:glycosyltransferase involved in cell wall biosynthesis
MCINIIIPVHNRKELTEQTIHSLYQTGDKNIFDLYVVDDASDEDTASLLQKMKNDYGFKLFVQDENKGPAICRNEVCEYITLRDKRGKFLYHSDNDVFFEKNALSTLFDAFCLAREKIHVLGGGCHPYLQTKDVCQFGTYEIGTKDAVSGYSQIMTWDTWDTYGPFDTEQSRQEKKIMGSEDWAFCQRIISKGGSVGSLIREVVVHCGKTNTYNEKATGYETFKDIDGIKII